MLSKNGAGLIILALSIFGVSFTESQATEVITALGTIVSFILMVWNQAARPDVKAFLFKK